MQPPLPPLPSTAPISNCVRKCVRACMPACMRACIHACMHACEHPYVRACGHGWMCATCIAVAYCASLTPRTAARLILHACMPHSHACPPAHTHAHPALTHHLCAARVSCGRIVPSSYSTPKWYLPACEYVHACARERASERARARACVRANMRACVHTYCARAWPFLAALRKRSIACTHAHAPVHTYTHTPIHIHTCMHSCTHTLTHTSAHTHK